MVKSKIENYAVEKEKENLKKEVEKEIKENLKNEIKLELKNCIRPLDLTPGEDNVLRQLADGKMLKEVEGVSKNTKTDYVESAMLKNGCKNKNELIAVYSLNRRLPELFPCLFQDK